MKYKSRGFRFTVWIVVRKSCKHVTKYHSEMAFYHSHPYRIPLKSSFNAYRRKLNRSNGVKNPKPYP